MKYIKLLKESLIPSRNKSHIMNARDGWDCAKVGEWGKMT
jgi:hypothetical protein